MDMTISEQILNVSNRVCREVCKHYDKGKNLTGKEADKFFRDHCLKCPIIEL